MDRRRFVVLGAGALAGCAGQTGRRADGQTGNGPARALDAAQFHRERRFAVTPFGRIAYVERGAGPAALFLHGFPLNGFQWRGALERLAGERRCIAPDFLTMGYTEVAEHQAVGPDEQTDMLVALLDRLGVRSADIVASDSGGGVAQLLAARHPERVRTLLLTNCDTEIDSPPPALLPVIELSRAGRYVDEWLARWHANKTLARSATGLGGCCFTTGSTPTDEAIDCYLAPLLSSPRRKSLVHAYAIALEKNALSGTEAILRQRQLPVRIVWGTADDIFSARSPDFLDRLFPRSRGVRRVDGRKLFFPEEVPDIIAAEAQQLWRS